MSRLRKPPRLYLRRWSHCQPMWVIRDGPHDVSTGCHEADVAGAERALSDYLARKFEAPGPLPLDQLPVAAVVASYLKEYVPYSPSREFLVHMLSPIAQWWGDKKLSDIRGKTCREYVAWRTAQHRRQHPSSKRPRVNISRETARKELSILRAAIKWYDGEHGPLPNLPKFELPEKGPRRIDYWLRPEEVAARIRAARKDVLSRHVARFTLIGVYSGTRPGTILGLSWLPSTTSGWFDLETGVLHRRGTKSGNKGNKKQPPVRIHSRLLPHLRRWRDADLKAGITNVIHFEGQPVKTIKRSWKTVAREAGAVHLDAPHIVRHTAATWLMQDGVNLSEAAGYLGMSPETLWEHYGHHHPDFQEEAARARPRRRKGAARKVAGAA